MHYPFDPFISINVDGCHPSNLENVLDDKSMDSSHLQVRNSRQDDGVCESRFRFTCEQMLLQKTTDFSSPSAPEDAAVVITASV